MQTLLCNVFFGEKELTNRINLPSPLRSKMAVFPTDENAGE